MNNKILRRFVSLQKRRRKLEGALSNINEKIKNLKPVVLLSLNKAEVASITISGMTLYTSQTAWTKIPDDMNREEVIQRLKEIGLGHYVKENFSDKSLSVYIREEAASAGILLLEDCPHLSSLEGRGIELPPELKRLSFLGISIKYDVGTRLS